MDYIKKSFKWKLYRIKFPTKNSVEAYHYLPHHRSGAIGRQTTAMYWNGKVGSFGGWTLPKVPIVLKNASNKNCTKFNFQQKTQGAQVFISPRSGARGHQRFAIFKMHWNGKLGTFRAGYCQKYRFYRKMQTKIVEN